VDDKKCGWYFAISMVRIYDCIRDIHSFLHALIAMAYGWGIFFEYNLLLAYRGNDFEIQKYRLILF